MIEAHLETIKDLFFEKMDRRTSAWMYGSAANGDWVPFRSDLDLFILIPEGSLELFSNKVRAWTWAGTNPILDGYVLYFSGSSVITLSLEQLASVAYPSEARIELIDQWYIKNRSKHLFGEDSLPTFLPEIAPIQLREWAIENLRRVAKAEPRAINLKFSELIWSVSWSARMTMLARGEVCESKLEALKWLSIEVPESSYIVSLLIEGFNNSDNTITPISLEQSVMLRRLCMNMMINELKSQNSE